MHEFSVVSSLLEQCDELAKQNKAKSISRIAIKIGILSGVEPSLLKTAFDTFKLEGICKNALLQIQIQPLLILCNSCGIKAESQERNVICQHCKSYDTKVIDGEQMTLMQLDLEK